MQPSAVWSIRNTAITLLVSLPVYALYGQHVPLPNPADSTGAARRSMEEDTIALREVMITVERPQVDVKLDKKIYTIGKDILSQSGAATDVLNGIPSVSTDAAGVIRLRGNGNVTLLINGRRSGLLPANVLSQIPAGSIESIEVMTSPSARYDAAGSAGIINIILKKSNKKKFDAHAGLAAGSPNDYNLNANLNYKIGKVNLFATLGGRYSDYVGFYTTKQTATGINALSLEKVQHENRHDDGRLFYLGGDYQVGSKSTFTLALFKNATKDIDGTTLDYAFGNTVTDSSIIRRGSSRESRSYNQLESGFIRTFGREGQKLTIDLQYDFWDSDKTWNLSTTKTYPVEAVMAPVRTGSLGDSHDLVVQSDFAYPFSNQSTLETGAKLETRSVISDYIAEQYLNGRWEVLDHIDNEMDYREKIGAVYTQYRSKPGKLSYQLGLRYEYTNVAIHDRKGDFGNIKHYGRIFPTLNLSYALSEQATIQANYSRRITRPALWQLYPFYEVTDFNAQFTGNPHLNPTLTHAVELALTKQWGSLSLNPAIFMHFVTAPVQQYTYQNYNEVMITMPFNLAGETRYGAELSVNCNPLQWLSVNGQLTGYAFRQRGFYRDTDFNFLNHSWNGRLNMRVKLPGKLTIQARLNAQGADNNAQTRTRLYYYLATGLSKSLFKDKAAITLDGANILNTNKQRMLTTGANYIIDRTSNFNAARFRLGLSYRFSKSETPAFRSRKNANRN